MRSRPKQTGANGVTIGIGARTRGPATARQAALAARFPTWQACRLDEMLDRVAQVYPDRAYIITDTRTWTYAEVAQWSRRLAAGLRAQGVTEGDHVALIMANDPAFIALKFAISRIGAVAVPINVQNRRDELSYLLAQSDCAMLITMDAFRDNDFCAILDELMPGWETQGGGKHYPRLKRVALFHTGSRPLRATALTFNKLACDSTNSTAAPGRTQATAVCDILYTSGTTGAPKGVMLSHDQMLRAAYGSAYARAFEDGRRILFSLPLYHVYGYVEGMLAALFVGGAVIVQSRFDAVAMLTAIKRHRATDLLLIPTMTLALIDAAQAARHDTSSLQGVLSSGGRAPERIWQAITATFGDVEITTGYGMTECTASTTVTRPDDPASRLMTTNGRQRDVGVAGDPDISNRLVTYQVRDPSTGVTLPVDTPGELVAKGPGVTSGYYNKPAETAATFTPDGWLRTGDLGTIDSQGYIRLIGRTKESYRCGGELVLPTEIEDLLTSSNEVLQAHVVPIPDGIMGEIGVAFVELAADATATPEQLRQLVATRLARFKVPRHVFIINAADLPVTASGRVRKFLLAEHAAQRVASL